MFTAVALFLFQFNGADLDTTALASARCVQVAESPDQRVEQTPQIAPGAPPIIAFRYFEGQLHHRFLNTDLTLDDAGH